MVSTIPKPVTKGEGTQFSISNSKISAAERHYYKKFGNVVVADLTFTVGGTAITGNTEELFSGLPKSYSGNIRFRCPSTQQANAPILTLAITTDGKIINQWSQGGLIANHSYGCSFVYICED